MTYFFVENRLGMGSITAVDAGYTPANGSSAIPTSPTYPGMIARAVDATLGEGEFILLLGAANTVAGSVVTYNNATYATTLLPNTANLAEPIAVAMAATVASNWGWYQISGVATLKKTAVKVNPAVALYISSTTGRVSSTSASGKQLLGTRSANTATIASATSTINAIIDRPHLQGQIT